MNQIKRPINYYGSKERLCPKIYRLIPEGPDTWADIFCGSAVVTLKKPRHKRETINDMNEDIINLFAVLRDNSQRDLLNEKLEMTPYSEAVLKQVYDIDPANEIEKAWCFLIWSWFGRGGDFHRTGFRWSKGQTTAPEITWSNLPNRLSAVAERLRGVCVRQTDAIKLIDDYDTPECILFVDPPYPGPVGRRYKVKMTAAHHEDLANRLKECRANVILTMNPETIYSTVLTDWIQHDVSVLGGGQQVKPEVILTNYEPAPLLAFGSDKEEPKG